MTKPNLTCPTCKYEAETPRGWRYHMGASHGGYTREQLQTAGIEESAHDRIKFMSGFRSSEEVAAAAPATEGEAAATNAQGRASVPRTRQPRLSKEEQEKAQQLAEFERLKPVLINKWKRRLRMVYGVWARMADDPKIKLTDSEADEGSEMHVELMQAFGWIHAGKIEAIADLVMWHGGMILSRSQLGEQLLAQFHGEPTPETEQVQ
jgi:hypothetical protein